MSIGEKKWLEEGEKNGYSDYFRNRILEEIKRSLPRRREHIENSRVEWNCAAIDSCICESYNLAIKDVEERLEKLKN